MATWTRSTVPQEVLSVMAATMWGSLDTLVRSLGGKSPRSMYLEVEDRRIFGLQLESRWTLLLVAPRTTAKRRLQEEAERIAARVSRVRTRDLGRPNSIRIRE